MNLTLGLTTLYNNLTLVKLFTPVCLCQRVVWIGTSVKTGMLWNRVCSTEDYHSHHSVKFAVSFPSSLLDNIWVMVIVWRLRGSIIRTDLCWIVWHNVHSQQHTYMSSSYRSNGLGLSHRDSYVTHRGGCLKLHYCNIVERFRLDSSLILTTDWFPSVLWHWWFGHLTCKIVPIMCWWEVKQPTN